MQCLTTVPPEVKFPENSRKLKRPRDPGTKNRNSGTLHGDFPPVPGSPNMKQAYFFFGESELEHDANESQLKLV